MASLYLYLEKVDWCQAWIEGGEVPAPRLASSYLAEERSGTKTPDEAKNVVTFGGDPNWFLNFLGGGNIHHCVAERNIGPNGPLPDVFVQRHEHEDVRIMCFSRHFHWYVGSRLKKTACVRIPDIDALKCDLDRQFGAESEGGACKYTTGHNKGHFLKGVADAWQDEYRLVWPASADVPQGLIIPSGTARWHAIWGDQEAAVGARKQDV